MSAELKRFSSLADALADVDHAGELYLRLGDGDAIPAEVGQLHRLRSLYVTGERKLPYRIPPEVVALHQLRAFHPGGAYDTFPPEILDMRQLEELELGWPTQLGTLPDALVQLDRLAVLKLRGTGGAIPEVLTRLPSLRVLELDDWDLASLPASFANLAGLEVLKLVGWADRPLARFPDVLFALTKLRELWLEYGIPDVPAGISKLAKLESLTIVRSSVERLPPEIGALARLRSLTMWENKLAELPASIGELASLEELDLTRNELRMLPPEIGKLGKLRKLDLRGNPLPTLPPEIGDLAALRQLELGERRSELASIPREIGKLVNLDVLSLQDTQLGTLPPEIGGLASLRCCYLRRSQLTAIPDTIGLLGELEILALDGNQLTTVPDTLAACTSLTDLDLTGNTFAPDAIAKLKTIAGVLKTRKGYIRLEMPRTAADKVPVPTEPDARPLSPDVLAQIERLGGKLGPPGEAIIEKLALGNWPLPAAIRQLHRDVKWPPGSLYRGTVMKGWGAKVLEPPHYVVDLRDYECSQHAPYYPLTCEQGGQVYYVCRLDSFTPDPSVYRLDCHDYREHHPMNTGLTLAQLLAKLRPIAGAEQRALIARVYRAEGAERAEVAAAVAKLPKKKLVDLEARTRLHWLLEQGGDPEHDTAIRIAALVGLAKLGPDAAESAKLVASMVEHADARVRAAAGKAAAKLRRSA